jgi:hypothetical protein
MRESSVIAVACVVFFFLGAASVSGCEIERRSAIAELRATQAVQEVELRDARERLRALELDLDLVAPRSPRAP